MVRIDPLNHRDASIAAEIHAVLMLAYAQEATLLQVDHFKPLDRTAEEIRTSNEYFVGAMEGGKIIGAISIAPDDEPNQLSISSLVVHPEAQRRGIARLLLAETLRRGSGMVFSVSPASRIFRHSRFTKGRASFSIATEQSVPKR